jgi:hypothetical protein
MLLLPTSLLALIPLAIASPILNLQPRDANQGCSKASFGNFSWTIENFDYHASYVFTTPAHQNSWGYVNFNLSNPALPYKATCSGASSQLSEFFYGDFWYSCSVPDGSLGASGATFAFNRAAGELDFNQTWVCSDEDPKYPYVSNLVPAIRATCWRTGIGHTDCATRATFRGYAAANLTLDCSDTTWTNPNWTMGQIYSDRTVECEAVTLPVKPYMMTAVA